MNLFSNHYKNLRSVIRNRHSVTRNGHSEVRNAHSVSRNGDFLRQRYNFYSITARFLQYILTFLSKFNVSLQTCRHLHLVDCRYGIILTVDIKVENPLVEDYGVVESGDVNGMVALLESDKDALQGLSAPDVALP